jgi:hypothetical protein
MGDREAKGNENSALEKGAYFMEHMDYMFLCPQEDTLCRYDPKSRR